MKEFAISSALVVLFLSTNSSVALAQYGPYQGPQPSLSILIDKLVGVPTAQGSETVVNFVDNLGVNDFKFKADNIVFFKLKVKNTSNVSLDNVVVKDNAPAYVDLFENPGTYDSVNRVLTINVGSLGVNQEKEYIVRARVTSSGNLPVDSGIVCVMNKAVASNDKVSDEDTAQLCIEKPVLGTTSTTTTTVPSVTKIPSTGPEAGMLILSMSGALGYLGLKLRKVQ